LSVADQVIATDDGNPTSTMVAVYQRGPVLSGIGCLALKADGGSPIDLAEMPSLHQAQANQRTQDCSTLVCATIR